MATEGAPVKVPTFEGKTYIERMDAEHKWEVEWLRTHRHITFSVADGRAVYEVRGNKRLTLHHLPTGDAYRIPAAHIRWLSREDIENREKSETFLRAMFGPSKMEYKS